MGPAMHGKARVTAVQFIHGTYVKVEWGRGVGGRQANGSGRQLGGNGVGLDV